MNPNFPSSLPLSLSWPMDQANLSLLEHSILERPIVCLRLIHSTRDLKMSLRGVYKYLERGDCPGSPSRFGKQAPTANPPPWFLNTPLKPGGEKYVQPSRKRKVVFSSQYANKSKKKVYIFTLSMFLCFVLHPPKFCERDLTLVLISDGSSEHVADVWCKICLYRFFSRIWRPFRCNQMPSTNRNSWYTPYVGIVKWATI